MYDSMLFMSTISALEELVGDILRSQLFMRTVPTRRSGFPYVRQVAHAEFPILAPDCKLALERIKQPESGAVHGVRPQQVAAGQQAQLG